MMLWGVENPLEGVGELRRNTWDQVQLPSHQSWRQHWPRSWGTAPPSPVSLGSYNKCSTVLGLLPRRGWGMWQCAWKHWGSTLRQTLPNTDRRAWAGTLHCQGQAPVPPSSSAASWSLLLQLPAESCSGFFLLAASFTSSLPPQGPQRRWGSCRFPT